MAAHPVAAYKRVTMKINGVTKNFVVPVSASHQNQKDNCQNDNNYDDDDDDDDCIITDVELSQPDVPSESSQLVPEQSDPHLVHIDVQPVEISPSDDEPVYDLTTSPEKVVPSCEILHPSQNNVTSVHSTDVASPGSRRPTGIVMPMTMSSNASANTADTGKSVDPLESQPTFTSATVDNADDDLESLCADTHLLLSETSTVPVVITPLSSAEVSTVSVISSPRTMTKWEAVAAGWFTDEDRADYLQTPNAISATQSSKARYDASELTGTALTNSFSVDPVVENSFMSSAEYVSLEPLNVVNDRSTDLAMDSGNHVEMVPAMSSAPKVPYTYPVSGNPELEIDVAVDRKPRLTASETKMCHKLEKLSGYDDEERYNYDNLMSEEDEPLTAVMEGMNNDNAVQRASAKVKPVTKATKKTAEVKRGRGRPPKSKLQSVTDKRKTGNAKNSGGRSVTASETAEKTSEANRTGSHPVSICHTAEKANRANKTGCHSVTALETAKKANKARRTAGHPFTAAERYRLKDCGVWLQQLRLPAASVKMRFVWRYLCCRDLTPRNAGSCSLCRGRRNSDSFAELEVAQKFRAGIRHCTKAAKKWCEFSVDTHVLAASAASESKKYLLVQTGTRTFVIPVDSAVGRIVSEQEIANMLRSQPEPSLSSYAGEFSNDALLEACSQLQQSDSCSTASLANEPLSAKARNTSVSTAGRKRRVRKTNAAAVRRVSKRELRALNLSFHQRTKAKRKSI